MINVGERIVKPDYDPAKDRMAQTHMLAIAKTCYNLVVAQTDMEAERTEAWLLRQCVDLGHHLLASGYKP